MTKKYSEMKQELELLLDRATFSWLLGALEEICSNKEIHLLEAWQDKKTARVWKNRAILVRKLIASELNKNGVQPF